MSNCPRFDNEQNFSFDKKKKKTQTTRKEILSSLSKKENEKLNQRQWSYKICKFFSCIIHFFSHISGIILGSYNLCATSWLLSNLWYYIKRYVYIRYLLLNHWYFRNIGIQAILKLMQCFFKISQVWIQSFCNNNFHENLKENKFK